MGPARRYHRGSLSMRRLIVVIALVGAAGSAGVADSRHASLRVGVEVTRKCSVVASPSSGTLDVQCTRAGPDSVQTSIDGRRPTSSPLVTLGPGLAGAVVPVGASGASATRVVTILF
jgi:hypothetical protein